MLSFHNNHLYLCTKASFLHCMHSYLCYFFCYSHYYKGFSMPSNNTIRVNLESFNQIIKLNIKRQLKWKDFSLFLFLSWTWWKHRHYFISSHLFRPCCMTRAILIHDYRSRLKLDQSTFHHSPGTSEVLFHVSSSDQFTEKQIFSLHFYPQKHPKHQKELLLHTHLSYHASSSFSIKSSYQEINRSSTFFYNHDTWFSGK